MSGLEVVIHGAPGRVEVSVEVLAGQQWRRKDERVPWTVTRVDGTGRVVGLTGPGPCRSYRSVSFATFSDEWEPTA